MSKVCTDCFWCKINRSKGYIRCIVNNDNESFSHWMDINGIEKIIKLNHSEMRKTFIEWRDQFKLAQRCTSMKSMI